MEPVIAGDELFYDTDLAECFRACSNYDLCTVIAFDNENNTCRIYWELEFRNMSTVEVDKVKVYEIVCLGTSKVYI